MEWFVIGLVSGCCLGFTLSRMIPEKEPKIVEKPVQIEYRRPPRKKFFCRRCDSTVLYEETYDTDDGVCCPYCDNVLERKK